VLAPVRTDTMIDPIVGRSRSHRHLLAQKLALMATGRQTESSPADALPSPFSGNTLNHLVRFAIIDGPPYNGRIASDSLVETARGDNPLVPQPVDRLTTPYLLFAADVDAPGDGSTALRAYTGKLWATMKEDLLVIFGHCVGFDGIDTPDKFHDYIRLCQVETTMPFNDYWPDGLAVGNPALPAASLLKWAAIVALGAFGVWALALLLNGVLTVVRQKGDFARAMADAAGWGAIVVLLLFAVMFILAYGLYRWIIAKGLTPFPAAPGSDLPSVLKALFVQQNFTRFVIEAQGLDEATLQARFDAFLAAVKPGEAEPTQQPGEIRAPTVDWAR